MVTGYGGTYRGSVVDADDPMQRNRLLVIVPEVYGDAPAWAAASLSSPSAALPAVGDLVWVSFEHGDSDYPVWQHDGGTTSGVGGYVGKYRGRVVGNDDPMQANRLQVEVPDVDPSPAWASAAIDIGDEGLPDVGSDVWIEYEYGDPAYPRWVGLA
jgi:hypothetical protein